MAIFLAPVIAAVLAIGLLFKKPQPHLLVEDFLMARLVAISHSRSDSGHHFFAWWETSRHDRDWLTSCSNSWSLKR
jgi:hypothetical protein